MTGLKLIVLAPNELDSLAATLDEAGLPIADLALPGRVFFRFDDGQHAGFGGIEGSGADRLLRSLVVPAERRHGGLGRTILARIESEAAAMGVERLHLLTTTAAAFFRSCGYIDRDRASAPSSIAACREFTTLCPASAAYLVKTIGTLS